MAKGTHRQHAARRQDVADTTESDESPDPVVVSPGPVPGLLRSRDLDPAPHALSSGPTRQPGLPTSLRNGVEALSGMSMEGVTVHYASPRPAALGALAYTSGSDIHLGPGQERHLPHEAWHVVQQARGSIAPTIDGTAINDDARLEREADVMGRRAARATADLAPAAVAAQSGREPSGPAPTGAAVQRVRDTNPYATGQSHDGWELTAHHIVGHGKLTDAFDLLTSEEQKKIYAASIPTDLTRQMLAPIGVIVPEGETEKSVLVDIRKKLVDPDFTDEILNIKVDTIRGSFFEWQRGNQFSGPNTSIRTEPTANKDDLDYDGEFFADDFDQLKTAGEDLYTKMKTYKTKGGKTEESRVEIYDALIEILKLTVDATNAAFDPAEWTEITSVTVLEELAKKLKRPHMLNYAYFRLAIADTHTYGLEGEATYDALRSTSQGNSEFTYNGIALKPTVKGTNLFFSVPTSRTVVGQKGKQTVRTFLRENGFPEVPAKKAPFTITAPPEKRAFSSADKLRLKCSNTAVTHSGMSGDKLTYTFTETDGEVEVVNAAPEGDTLATYLTKNGAHISSYLPKKLVEKVTEAPVIVVKQISPALEGALL